MTDITDDEFASAGFGSSDKAEAVREAMKGKKFDQIPEAREAAEALWKGARGTPMEFHELISTTCIAYHARMSSELSAELATAKAEMSSAHAILDKDPSKIIRNAKDGYPEGREPRILTLAERVSALCQYAADYVQWTTEAEAERDSLRAQLTQAEAKLSAALATTNAEPVSKRNTPDPN